MFNVIYKFIATYNNTNEAFHYFPNEIYDYSFKMNILYMITYQFMLRKMWFESQHEVAFVFHAFSYVHMYERLVVPFMKSFFLPFHMV